MHWCSINKRTELFTDEIRSHYDNKPSKNWITRMQAHIMGRSWRKSKFLKKVINVCVDLINPFFVNKVSCPFNYNYILQKWHTSLQPTLVKVILHTWSIIGQVNITHNKLNRNFDFSSSPRRSEFPGPANARGNNVNRNLSKVKKAGLSFEYCCLNILSFAIILYTHVWYNFNFSHTSPTNRWATCSNAGCYLWVV